jgi:hypothetical protein
LTVGFDVSVALGKVVLVDPVLPVAAPRVGRLTPWSFRQLL